MTKQKVSVVIPAYNAERFLSATVESVLGQSFDPLEVIIVDDVSTDNTLSLAQEYARRDGRVKVARQTVNSGLAATRNRGLPELDPASFAIHFLDSDDILESDAIEGLVEVLERYPSCAAAYGLPRLINAEGRPIFPEEAETYSRDRYRLVPGGVERCSLDEPATFEMFVIANCIYTPGQVLIRRKAMERAGEFDAMLRSHEDWDYWLRLSSVGELRLLNRLVLSYRRHGANMTSNLQKMKQGEAVLWRKLEHSSVLTAQQRAMLRLGRQWLWRVTSRYWLQWAKASVQRGQYLQALNQVRHALQDQMRFYVQGLKETVR